LFECTWKVCWKEIVANVISWFFIYVMVWAFRSNCLSYLLQKSQDMGKDSKIHYSKEV
jgi:hypothetical protein